MKYLESSNRNKVNEEKMKYQDIFCVIYALGALVTSFVEADPVYLAPPTYASHLKPIAVIWIHGMECKPEAYKTISQEFQQVAAEKGFKVWVGIPEFILNIPQPLMMDHYVKSTFNVLKSKYSFPGNQIYLAAHSLGGVMTQLYAKGKSDFIKGQILMAAVLLRNTRHITNEGKTSFDYDIPTLTLNGELDGLMRITRSAEAYWHANTNIVKSQADKFPVVALEGLSHSSFMDFSMLPSTVKSSDIQPEVDEKTGHNMTSNLIASFIASIEGEQNAWTNSKNSIAYTKDFMNPLLEAMVIEGSYNLKQPCYNKTLINDNLPGCLKGSKWSEHAQRLMSGELYKLNAGIDTQDNFHRAYTFFPVDPLPQINNSCVAPNKRVSPCSLESITVTENFYNRLNSLDTGKYEIGAVEMKAKLMSRQSVRIAAGDKQADFHETDEVGNRCGEINQEALNWALAKANSKAIARYNLYGKKLVIGADLGPYNIGPLWIWNYIKYVDNADKTETTVQAPMMRTPVDYFLKPAAGFHFCKLLSPFRALEWIYIDSQYDHNGIRSNRSPIKKIVFN